MVAVLDGIDLMVLGIVVVAVVVVVVVLVVAGQLTAPLVVGVMGAVRLSMRRWRLPRRDGG